jgi:putative addiction module component (TIGR02574 family)
MTYDAILAAAQQLSDDERRRLVDALWQSMPDDPAWEAEIDRRMNAADRDDVKGTTWQQVRDEALASLDDGRAS